MSEGRKSSSHIRDLNVKNELKITTSGCHAH